MARHQRLHHLRQQVHDGAAGAGEAHAPDLAVAMALDGRDGVVGLAQQAPGAGHQVGAGGGRHHAAVAAHQQRRIEAGLELADVQADRGLREMQRAAGRREGAEIGDGDERAQLVEVEFSHSAIISFPDIYVQDSRLPR